MNRRGHTCGTQRYHCVPCDWHGTAPIGDNHAGIDRDATKKFYAKLRKAKGVKRYVITAAQNATPINKPFFESLLGYCKANRAQLVVIPYRYKNPTSMWTADAKADDWWAAELVPYILDRRIDLCPTLTLLADIKTQPTATAPLNGYETMTGARSAVIGHPKLALKTVPTPQTHLPKLVVTTGAVTQRNYIPSKAGKTAEHHHTFGACAVDIRGSKFFLRQINAVKDGSFIDLTTEYRGAKTRKVTAAALVMGDTHQEFVDPGVVKATFGKGGMVDALKPATLVWHDLHDFYARNHHHRGEVFINYVKHHTGNANVSAALKRTFEFVDGVTPKGVENIFVPSNHPDALARWVKESDPKTDPENCVFWAETFTAMCKGAGWAANGAHTIDPFAHWGRQWCKSAGKRTFLARGESLAIHGIELGFHGDKGSNGARGSVKSYSRIGVKTITGHGHAPEIEGGAYRVGTNSMLRLGYNEGAPSSWLHADCVVYANGKRSLLFIIDGEWRV